MKMFPRILSIVMLAALTLVATQCRHDKQDLLGFALIPAGEFTMGDERDGITKAPPEPMNVSAFYMPHPPHNVNVSAFYMLKTEVTKAEWREVRAWGLKNGYTDLSEGNGKAAYHPTTRVTWYEAVKWCNAKSVKEGLVPCYYTDAAQTEVYKTGELDLANTMVKWTANGYRLPTEAEWEKAARGGLSGKRFPWGDTINHEQANFRNENGEPYQKGTTGYHPTYKLGKPPYTSPVGSFAANGYGLYDMAGNVVEWCWDKPGEYPLTLETDPRGATCGSKRVVRGGGWSNGAGHSRCALRNDNWPGYAYDAIGFRLARGQP
jgi:formylglycine-generating enzyme required for sulfatase activity